MSQNLILIEITFFAGRSRQKFEIKAEIQCYLIYTS